MWNTRVQKLDEDFRHRIGTTRLLRYMYQLHLMIRVSQTESHTVISKDDVIYFPSCYNSNDDRDAPRSRPRELQPSNKSIYIDFRNFFCAGFFVQLMQDLGAKCKGGVRLESPYYVVIITESLADMHVEYCPETAQVHCVVW
jgi:hypothetical protein